MESIEEEKSYSKWEWFLYIILLPILFTLILVGIILTFMKVDIVTPLLDLGNKIPIVEKMIPDSKGRVDDDFLVYENTFTNSKDASDTSIDEAKKAMEEAAKYQKEVEEKESLILELEKELSAAETTIKELELELQRLQEAAINTTTAEQQQKVKEIAQMYSSMTPSKSAPILSNLDNKDAVEILAQIDSKKTSQILAKMNPQKAAELTLLLKEVKTSGAATNEELQQQIDALEKRIQEAKDAKSETEIGLEETVQSFEVMNRTAAADIFEKMWTDGNKKQALTILKKLKTGTLSGILAAMEPATAALITTELAK